MARRLPDITFDLLVNTDEEQRGKALCADVLNLRLVISDVKPFSLAEQYRLPLLADRYDAAWFTNYWVPICWPKRFVATVHDMLHLDPTLFPASRAKRAAARLSFGKVQRDAHEVIFVSRFTARAFADAVGAPRAASVIHHGVDHLPRGLLDIERLPNVVVVAAPKVHKNLATLLDAWVKTELDSAWTMTIVAPADRLRSRDPILGRARGTPRVKVMQGVSDAALSDTLASAAVVAVPSRYEGFGFPLLEGMLSGAQCISSTADALVEIAGQGAVRFVAPLDRAGWVEALREAATAHQTGNRRAAVLSAQKNIAAASEYTWSSAVEATAAVLARVTAS